MNFTKHTLKNNLRLILAPQDGSLTTTILFLVEAGSKYETKKINGLSHFLEHMCFKGTTKRPRPIDISSELDAIGAQYNAFTGHEYTGYYAKARNEDFEKIFDVLADIFLNSTLSENEINQERGVIIEEINMYEDTPMRQVHNLFTEVLYGDQPAGWDIAGKKENILSLTRKDFVQYRQSHYLPNATALIISGGFDTKKAEHLSNRWFGDIKTGEKGLMRPVVEKQEQPQTGTKFKDTDQAHIVLGVRSYSAMDERRYILSLLANILGGWMSSRLFQRVREQLGAAYYIRAQSELFYDHGYLAVSAGVALDKINDVIAAILDEFNKMKTEPITEKELGLAKGHVIGSTMIGLETSDALANFYGSQEISQKEILTIEQILEKIKSVSAKDIFRVSQDIFNNDKLNLAAIGPIKDSSKLESLLGLQ